MRSLGSKCDGYSLSWPRVGSISVGAGVSGSRVSGGSDVRALSWATGVVGAIDVAG